MTELNKASDLFDVDPTTLTKKQTARNPYKKVFEHKTWGGMPMASISVHEDDFSDESYETHQKELQKYKNIRVEICVAGRCIGTTLDNIINSAQELASAKEEGAREERSRIINIVMDQMSFYESGMELGGKLIDQLTNPKESNQ